MGEQEAALEELERRVQSMTVEFRMLEGVAGELRGRIGVIDSLLRELDAAIQTLKNLDGLSIGDELLIPVGGSNFVKAKLADKERVMVGIGAGVTVEKPIKDALTLVEGKVEELNKTRMNVEQQLVQVLERMEYLRSEIQKILKSF
jgi:prefoldin alpha subunit